MRPIWTRAYIQGEVLTLGEVVESVALFDPPPTEIYVSPFTMAKFVDANPTMSPAAVATSTTWRPHQFLSEVATLDWFTSTAVPDDGYELRWPTDDAH